jgi:phage terminase large subunit-like protein
MMVDTKILQMLQGLNLKQIQSLLGKLSPDEAFALLDDWSLWAMEHQQMPSGNWRRWVMRAGRGAGKGYGAAKTVNEVARDRSKIKTGEIGIVARTYSDVRYTCVEGPSGILATAPSDFKPVWYPGHGLLVWPNGVRGRIFSADKPEGMRGPNWSFLWADEICHWPEPKKTWWEAIEPALRIGWARCVITTTPLPDPFLQELEAKDDTVVTRASTFDNKWLPEIVKQGFREHYEGTRLGKQELYGEFLEDNVYALWAYETIENHRVSLVPDLKRVVVSIDPAVTANENSDETGIIVFGIAANNHGFVLEDATGIYTPTEWARKAVELYNLYKADRIVAEVNQGGDMVEGTIRAIDPTVSYAAVRATRGKLLRAEPVAALYERGLIHHVGVYDKLESQLVTWVPGKPSPDRLDALVWASTFLQLSGDKPVGSILAYL